MYSEDIRLEMEKHRAYFIACELRDNVNELIYELFERTDLTEYQKLYILHTSEVLPLGVCMNDCPEVLRDVISKDIEHEYEPVYFLTMLNVYKNDFTDINNAIHEVYEWVKENEIIGTHIIW